MPPAADALRTDSAAIRLHWSWWGSTKAVNPAQRNEVAACFAAESRAVTAGKKLFDTKGEDYRRLTGLKTEITNLWLDTTLPYPEPGVRLIRRSLIPQVDARFADYKARFDAAAADFAAGYERVKQEAKDRLGRLFSEADYPADVRDKFGFAWDYPNVEPPEYLMNLNPALYRQEQERVRSRFEQAVAAAEQGFAAELQELVTNLAERLRPGPDGQRKVLRDSAVENLREFFTRFKSLNVGSNAELDRVVAQAEQVLGTADAATLRTDADARLNIADRLGQVGEALAQAVVTPPRRAFRRAAPANPAAEPTPAAELTPTTGHEPEAAA